VPEKLDGYVRVSVVGGRTGDRFQSPTAQRESIEGWAKAHGVTIAAWHEDLDQSGGTMDRPGMNAALLRIEQGKTGGIVVARLDRFARTVIGGLTTIQTLTERGARVVSVAESIDPATPMGRAMLGLLLIMAAWQRDQADEALAGAQQRAATAGRFPGKPAYGYRRDPQGRTTVDRETAKVVRRIYRLRAKGRGWRAICDDLIRDGIRTPSGGERWAPSTVGGIIRSEAYLGVFVGPRGLRVEGAWPPLVDPGVWEQANAVRGVRNSIRHSDRLLAGIARCATCRHVLVRAVNHHGYVSYACATVGCQQRVTIGAGLLDSYAAQRIQERLDRARLRPRIAGDDERARLATAADVAQREFEAWRDDLEVRQAIGEHDYRAGLLVRARARDDAQAALAQHEATNRLSELTALSEMDVSLETLPWEVRRELALTLLHSVWVRRSDAQGAAATRRVGRRVLLVWRDDHERPELPSAGELQPFRWG
jgi:DNA invertase Pin-like site-specific DNA recombinase